MKQIYVQAQPDHIESLSKSAPIAAVEELVWNALDADAREVKVDLITNPLGAVEAVRVSDDGTGIDAEKADATPLTYTQLLHYIGAKTIALQISKSNLLRHSVIASPS